MSSSTSPVSILLFPYNQKVHHSDNSQSELSQRLKSARHQLDQARIDLHIARAELWYCRETPRQLILDLDDWYRSGMQWAMGLEAQQ